MTISESRGDGEVDLRARRAGHVDAQQKGPLVTIVDSHRRESSTFPGFTVHIDRDPAHPSIADVYLSGDLDGDNTHRLADTMNSLIDHGSPTIKLNLTNVGFIDAAGLRSLIAADNLARRHNGQLIITGASAPVQRLMTLISPDLPHRTHEYPDQAE